MSWCTGAHTTDDECMITQTIPTRVEPSTIVLAAVPCSGLQVRVFGELWACDLDEFDELAAAFTALRPMVEGSCVEADCELHVHP